MLQPKCNLSPPPPPVIITPCYTGCCMLCFVFLAVLIFCCCFTSMSHQYHLLPLCPLPGHTPFWPHPLLATHPNILAVDRLSSFWMFSLPQRILWTSQTCECGRRGVVSFCSLLSLLSPMYALHVHVYGNTFTRRTLNNN